MAELGKNKIEISINDNDYICELAITDWEKERGLMNRDNLGDNEGMLFVYDELQPEISFWMKDTPIDLDIIFISPKCKIISKHHGIANNTDLITENNVQYVLELKYPSNVNPGDEVDLDDLEDVLEDKYEELDKLEKPEFSTENQKDSIKKIIKILDSDGEVQGELEGEERIFSRKNTKVLIRQAKKANRLKTDAAYKRLGKSIFKYMRIQDSNEPEYAKVK